MTNDYEIPRRCHSSEWQPLSNMFLALFIIFIVITLAALVFVGLFFVRHATELAAVNLQVLPEEKKK
jgi:hypothetical protein